jgi:hypothetical protein
MKHWTATALIALVQDTVEEEVPFVNKCRLEDVSDTPAFEIANGPVKMISDQCWSPLKSNGVTGGDEDLILYVNERLVPEVPRRQPVQEERISSTKNRWFRLTATPETLV